MHRLSVVGSLTLLLGVALVVGGVYFSLSQEASIRDVSQTEGEVLDATVERVEDGYYPNVTYRYEVGGTEYVSSNVFPPAGQQRGAERDEAEEVVRGYREGQSVTVYYPADDPAAASLRAPRDPGPVFAVGFGLVISAFGFIVVVAGRQRDRDVPLVQDDSAVDPHAASSSDAADDDHGDDADVGADGPRSP